MKSFLLKNNIPTIKWSLLEDGVFYEGTLPKGYDLALCPSDNYIILDDNNDMLKYQQKNFILTDCDDGLCKEDVEKAISMLNKD